MKLKRADFEQRQKILNVFVLQSGNRNEGDLN